MPLSLKLVGPSRATKIVLAWAELSTIDVNFLIDFDFVVFKTKVLICEIPFKALTKLCKTQIRYGQY